LCASRSWCGRLSHRHDQTDFGAAANTCADADLRTDENRSFTHPPVISVKTVERHRANVLQKLGMRDRTQLTRYAIRAGLIEP